MMEEQIVSPNEEAAALEARQRRIERRRGSTKRTKEDDDEEEELDPESDDDSWSSSSKNKRKKPRMTDLCLIRGVKKQARYEPEVEVPMTKAELAVWRKEARRVRNRESAAASRNKTRIRIDELKSQVAALQARYDVALQRIADLESEQRITAATIPAKVVSGNRVSPLLSPLRDDIPEDVDRHWSPGNVVCTNRVSPLLSPLRDDVPEDVDRHWSLPQQHAAKALANSLTTYSIQDDEVEAQQQHTPNFLPAAKISGSMDTATVTATTMNDSIFWSQGSVDMSSFKDIVFSSMDLGAAAAAVLTSSEDDDDDDDLAILSAVSDEDATTESPSEAASSDGGSDEHELGEFLWDTFDSFIIEDFTDLCPV